MKKYAKIISALCAVAMMCSLFALTACGDKPLPPAPPEKTLESIAVTRKPDKMEYYSGETFDPAGMEVTAYYSDSSEAAVTDYEYEPNGPLERGSNQEITVIYENKMTFLDGIVVEDPEITGTVYRFESEEAQILKGTTKYNCSYIRPVADASQGYVLDVRNNSKGGDTIKGGTDDSNPATHVGPKWVVHSDREATVRLVIRASLRTKTDSGYVGTYNPDNNFRAYKKNLSEMYGVFVNGDKLTEDTVMTAYGTSANSIQIYSEYQWRTVAFNINLIEGDNEIWFNVNGTKNAGAIDYIELVAEEAVLTNKTKATGHAISDDAGDWEMVKEPTRYEVGWIGKLCVNCNKVVAMVKLPRLNPDDYKSCTAVKEATETADGVGTYTYEYDGQTFTIENAVIPAKGEHRVYRFEGEDGHVTGKTEDGSNVNCAENIVSKGIDVGKGGVNLGRDVSTASGHMYLGSMGVAGNRVAYTLSADKAVTAVFTLCVAKPVISGKTEIALNKVWKVTVNGTPAFADTVNVSVGAANNSKTAPAYCDWVALTAEIPLVAGDNEIICEMQHDEDNSDATAGFASNFDYIEIASTALVTDKTVKTVAHTNGWTVTKAPGHADNADTNTVTGEATDAYCAKCGLQIKTRNVKTIEIPVISKENSEYRQFTTPEGEVWGEYTYKPKEGGYVIINFKESDAPATES